MTKSEWAALGWIRGMTLSPETAGRLRAAGHDPRAALRRARQTCRALYLATRYSGIRHEQLLQEAGHVERECYDLYGPDLGWAVYHTARQGECFAASAATADYIRRGGAY